MSSILPENPAPKTVLVTGGCGFIGSALIYQLVEAFPGARIINLDSLTYAGNPQNLEALPESSNYQFVQGDIGDGKLVAELLAKESVDWVLNLAAESHVDRSIDSALPFVDANVRGTVALLEAVRNHLRELTEEARQAFRFVHVSTDEVFGSLDWEDPKFCETTPYAPNSPYAASKAASDMFVRAFIETFKLPAIITNCSNNYGPRQFPEKLIPLMLLNAMEGKPLPVYGDGANIRDWLYVDDHARGIIAAALRGKPGESYLFGGRSEKRNLDLVHTMCDSLNELRPREDGKSYREQITFVKDRPGHDRRYAIDCDKAERDLGWRAEMAFEAGIASTIDWYLQNRAWCDAITSGNYQRQRLGLDTL
ncbi:dTDP-glucose 4,6-dehydratase [Cerasicoccus fimbriatus]|uniref:dTDP-glucose 4,6-dehydratase n=1 Tax=Cerasicoccus fimbriatus TaxID=3014554 RepID=UPI0022B53BE7|nr:dTDP-glucose 4,6-dehydratase [Cerasicoccus sp. TK19100]